MKNSGLGVGVPDVGRCRIEVRGGKLHLYSSAACIGQGMGTVQRQMVQQVTGLPISDIISHAPDTADAPDAGNTTASRQTLFTGEAAVRAAKQPDEILAQNQLRSAKGWNIGLSCVLGVAAIAAILMNLMR